MDPITLIVTALAAGIAAGTQQTTATAITEGYTKLKNILHQKFAGKPNALNTLAEYETDPDTYEKPLRKMLTEAGIDEKGDSDLISVAHYMLQVEQVQQVHIAHNQIINQGTIQGQVNENTGTINMSFNKSPKAGQ